MHQWWKIGRTKWCEPMKIIRLNRKQYALSSVSFIFRIYSLFKNFEFPYVVLRGPLKGCFPSISSCFYRKSVVNRNFC